MKLCIRKYSGSAPKLPNCDFFPKKYNGPTKESLTRIHQKTLHPALTTYYSEPLALHQGYKQWLFDLEGKRYLDMFGGICTVSVGHCHPKITAAVKEQMETLGHCSNVYLHPKIHEYAERLTEKMPGNLKVVYFVNSGSEANDLATLMARCHTGKVDIMSLKNGYHGMTYQTMALTAFNFYKYPVVQSPGFVKTMNPDPYRGLWGGNRCRDSPIQASRSCVCGIDECAAGNQYFQEFLTELDHSVPKQGLAAFFAESIQGVGGAVQFPKNYIKQVHEVIKKNGGVFVSDEVQTGFGRTGDHFWGFESHEIIPDIVTMAKGIGNGFPLAAVVTTPEIAQALTKSAHFNTFGGNPIACAVGITVLDIIEEEKLQQNSKEVGTYFLKELGKLVDLYPTVGDVRGKGLMIGMELVQDKKTKEPLESARFMKFWEKTRDLGVIIGKGGLNGNVVRIKPPMCITKEDVDFTIEVLHSSLKEI